MKTVEEKKQHIRRFLERALVELNDDEESESHLTESEESPKQPLKRRIKSLREALDEDREEETEE